MQISCMISCNICKEIGPVNLRQLDTLITIAAAGSLARAAGRLDLTQPAASRQIRAVVVLSVEAGWLLFARVTAIDVSGLAVEPLLVMLVGFVLRGSVDAEGHNAVFPARNLLDSGAAQSLTALAARGEGVAIVPSDV